MMNRWKMTLGANIVVNGVEFAVWAPDTSKVCLKIADGGGERMVPMERGERGIFRATVADVSPGSRYAFMPGDDPETPDPYSRSQPDGVHGRSAVIDPTTFVWTDSAWRGVAADDAIIYELHIGTFTPEGTWSAAATQLSALKELGITVIEVMPVAQFPGDRNWGYDGVNHFAPANVYGTPDDMRGFVDAAHDHGLAVILDVVYNHFGPEGNYTGRYTEKYLSETHTTDWGAALNWDGNGSEMVRQWAIDNVNYWITEFHIDGFRFDATHAMVDDSPTHIMQEIGENARAVAGDRPVLLYAEDGRHNISRARAIDRGGEGLDGTWADDFHHEMRVHLTNDKEMWLQHYGGTAITIAGTIAAGFGPTTFARGEAFATDEHDPASAFVFCLQNHDQVGNRPFGERLHHVINPDRYKVASALLLFAPETPLIFMGQEFAASTPFSYFTDMPDELGKLVTEGRRREFAGFGAFGDEHLRDSIPDPQAVSTFQRSKLRLEERESHSDVYALYRDLLRLRRDDPVLRVRDRRRTDARAIGAELISVLRWSDDGERLLLANFGPETATPLRDVWTLLLSTQDVRYGGGKRAVRIVDGSITVPERTAVVLRR